LIPLNSFEGYQDDLRRLKYGVIQKDDAITDLTHWDRFALAGRMQKPILTIFEDPEVVKASEHNLMVALNLAMLLNYHRLDSVDLEEIFLTLCNFSYKGDIRMRWKMENPDKVKNIVEGSLDGLIELYKPNLLEMENKGILSLNGSKIKFNHKDEHL
jgi:translocator assembly and maintenance protein 41